MIMWPHKQKLKFLLLTFLILKSPSFHKFSQSSQKLEPVWERSVSVLFLSDRDDAVLFSEQVAGSASPADSVLETNHSSSGIPSYTEAGNFPPLGALPPGNNKLQLCKDHQCVLCYSFMFRVWEQMEGQMGRFTSFHPTAAKTSIYQAFLDAVKKRKKAGTWLDDITSWLTSQGSFGWPSLHL